ncbi:MAG: hypothetical protein DRJ60_07090 [Thermoprotei archaeon]|nr:MAG: hypothetical protein DRJ60_07090 [Thermoprotei archaeon]
MVYSIFYYASEAITRALVGFILKVYEHMHRRKIVREKPRERPAPTWGFFSITNPYGAKEYVWIGKDTNLKVSIPALIKLPIKAHELEKPPTRLYFTFKEAASKDWFKEIEWLAEQAEKAKEGEMGAS